MSNAVREGEAKGGEKEEEGGVAATVSPVSRLLVACRTGGSTEQDRGILKGH